MEVNNEEFKNVDDFIKNKGDGECPWERKFKDLWYHYFDVFFKNKDFRVQVEFSFENLRRAKVIHHKIRRHQVFDKLYCMWNQYHTYLSIHNKYNANTDTWLMADRALAILISAMDVLVSNYHYMIAKKLSLDKSLGKT